VLKLLTGMLFKFLDNALAHHAHFADALDTLLSIQKRIIESALQKSKGKIYGPQGAANLLKIKPSTLQGKMKKLGIER
jgi:transcriptional regulator with GAF, ATPase, and Fis domain